MSKVEKSRKTGGRVAGTPNRRTLDIQQRLDELKCDPIEGMVTIAMNAEYAPELRGRMFSELAQYVAPKRKAIEHAIDPIKIQQVPTGMACTAASLINKIRGSA